MNNDIIHRVEKILRKHPATRDNDSRLIFMYYTKYVPLFYLPLDDGQNYEAMDVVKFFRLLANKHITSMSSISRARRKVQESFPELRGKMYGKRQANQSKVIKEIRLYEKNRYNQIQNEVYNDKLG